MGSIPWKPEGGPRPQTPSARDPGWHGGKTDYEKEALTIMSAGFMIVVARGKSFMVSNSSGEGMASSVRNESTKGSHEKNNPLIFQGVLFLG